MASGFFFGAAACHDPPNERIKQLSEPFIHFDVHHLDLVRLSWASVWDECFLDRTNCAIELALSVDRHPLKDSIPGFTHEDGIFLIQGSTLFVPHLNHLRLDLNPFLPLDLVFTISLLLLLLAEGRLLLLLLHFFLLIYI